MISLPILYSCMLLLLGTVSAVFLGGCAVALVPFLINTSASLDLAVVSAIAGMTLPLVGSTTVVLLARAIHNETPTRALSGSIAMLGGLLAVVAANSVDLPLELLELLTTSSSIALTLPFIVGWFGGLLSIAALSALVVLIGGLVIEIPFVWFASTGRTTFAIPGAALRTLGMLVVLGVLGRLVFGFAWGGQFLNTLWVLLTRG